MAARLLTAVSINDHQLLSDLLRSVLKDQGFELVASFTTAEEGLAYVTADPPALVVVEMLLPVLRPRRGRTANPAHWRDVAGFKQSYWAVREIRAKCAQTKVVVLTGERHPHNYVLAFQTGAHGVANKVDGLPDLLAVLRRVKAGETNVVSPRMRHELDQYLAHPTVELTALEIRVLELVQPGLTNVEIGKQLSLSRHTVKNTLGEINQKLGARNRIEAYERAEEMGLIGWRW